MMGAGKTDRWKDEAAAILQKITPMPARAFVIGAMVIVAFDTGEPLIALGATVFAASDSVLAVDRFVAPRPWAPLVVMVTYHVGQALIVAGVLASRSIRARVSVKKTSVSSARGQVRSNRFDA